MNSLYETAPNDWGRWGEADEIGRANLLTPDRVLKAAASIRTGRRYSLALTANRSDGDPSLPGRPPTQHRMLRDHSSYASDPALEEAGGMRSTDDWIGIACHGTTHIDALGHAYAGETIWNGYPAASTIGGLGRADIAALGAKGIVGRAVLIDIPRYRSEPRVARGERITVNELEAALAAQGSSVEAGDTLLINTGTAINFVNDLRSDGRWAEDEPGLTYEPELIDFIVGHDIAGLGTDTLCNEQAHSGTLGWGFPLHVLLQRNLGVVFHEALWLEDWAADCATDRVFDAFYVAAPIRLARASGAPTNPIVIK
jgi:kynurenine formamidase